MRIQIKNLEDCERFKEELCEFRDLLYIPAFPNEDEREPFENIIKRIKEKLFPETRIILTTDNGMIVGGIITDYPTDNIAQPIYIVVKESYRNKGVGRSLLEEAVREYGDVFVEIDNPDTVPADKSGMDPRKRKKMYEDWGFKVIPIDYVQPPLSNDGNYEKNLLLMHRANLTKKSVKKFLERLYFGLNASDSEELVKMNLQIDSTRF